MTNLPENNGSEHSIESHQAPIAPDQLQAQPLNADSPAASLPTPISPFNDQPHPGPFVWPAAPDDSQSGTEPPMFQAFTQPPPPIRIPHLGHLFLVSTLALMGFVAAIGLFIAAVHFHLFGAKSIQQAGTQIQYILGVEGAMYFFTFGAALLVFPAVWHESLFAGLQWNLATAVRLRWRLLTLAIVCFLLAWLNGELMPSPTNTPIEKVFRSPGAAWILFAFGVTVAPFFEEMFFRGFLLPALCTAYDWIAERITHFPPRPLGPNGHPQWSVAGMIVGSVATSIPFAAMHAQQTGYAFGPFLLLIGVSLVLCAVRLVTRSLSSSVFVHASYNFLLFMVMLIGTGGFRHFEKM